MTEFKAGDVVCFTRMNKWLENTGTQFPTRWHISYASDKNSFRLLPLLDRTEGKSRAGDFDRGMSLPMLKYIAPALIQHVPVTSEKPQTLNLTDSALASALMVGQHRSASYAGIRGMYGTPQLKPIQLDCLAEMCCGEPMKEQKTRFLCRLCGSERAR